MDINIWIFAISSLSLIVFVLVTFLHNLSFENLSYKTLPWNIFRWVKQTTRPGESSNLIDEVWIIYCHSSNRYDLIHIRSECCVFCSNKMSEEFSQTLSRSGQQMRQPIYEGDYSFNTGRLKTFTWLDYVIFAAILFISAAIGLYFAIKDRKNKSMSHFLLAGKNMSPIPVGLSLLASFMSAITLLGTPAEMYNYTTMYFWIGLGYLLVIAGAAHVYIPIFYHLGVTSAYEVRVWRHNQHVT